MIALLGHKKHRHKWAQCPAEIRKLLQAGANPEEGREPPLMIAARTGHLEVAKVLLEFGADVNSGRVANTPLLAAGDDKAMRRLLRAHGAKDTVFTHMVKGDTKRFEKCLAKDPNLVHLTDESDKTLLFYASGALDLPAMKNLLKLGADPNFVADRAYRITPLHEAVWGRRKGVRQAVRLLHQHGADLGAGDKGGVTALHKSVRDRNVDAVKILLELGAPVDAEDRGRKSTPLRRAVANTGRGGTSGKGDEAIAIVKLLLDFGANPKHRNRTGRTVIQSTRNPEIQKLLS